MKIYTAIEAAAKTSISKRTIQYKCKRDNIRKKLNVYQITDDVLKKWVEEDVNSPRKSSIARAIAHVPNNNKQDEFIRDLENELKDLKAEAALISGKQGKRIKDLENEVEELENDIGDLELEIEELEVDVKELGDATLEEYLPEIEGVPLEQIEAFEFQFKRSGEDEVKKGNLLFIQKGMVADEYTPEEYNNMKLNMENYQLMELKLDHKDELHAVEIKRIEQSKENKSKLHIKEVEKLIVERDYYKNSYYYVRRQNKDFLSLVMLSGKESMIKTVKDAKNTEWKK